MKKLLILGMMVLFLSSLIAVESEPSDVVGFVKYDLVAGDYNMVAVPMEITFTCVDPANPMASDLANEIGNVEQILYWDTTLSAFKAYSGDVSTDFAIAPGSAVMVKLLAGDDVTFYSVGDRPEDIATEFAVDYNMLMVPLNRPDLTMASELAADIGNVEQILYWDNTLSAFKSYSGDVSTDFPIGIGSSLMVKATATSTWNGSRNANKKNVNLFKK